MDFVFEPIFLHTKKNDPMGVNDGLYLVVFSVPLGQALIRLNLSSTKSTDDFSGLRNHADTLCRGVFPGMPDRSLRIFQGGETDPDNLLLLHSRPVVESSVEVFSPTIHLTEFKELLSQPSMPKPWIWKAVHGVTTLLDLDLDREIAAGNWERFKAPAMIAYGHNTDEMANIALKERANIAKSGTSFFPTSSHFWARFDD